MAHERVRQSRFKRGGRATFIELDAPLTNGESMSRDVVLNHFADPNVTPPDEVADANGRHAAIRKRVELFPVKLRESVKAVFGFDGQPMTLKQCERKMGVSSERVRQRVQIVLKKLRQEIRWSETMNEMKIT
jgi:DNA-directed RNA polymerase sigma subunit (sigma70/sigma32)